MKKFNYRYYFIFLFLIFSVSSIKSDNGVPIALLKYNGGGDWYANPSALPNLAVFCNQYMDTDLNNEVATVEVGSFEIFNYPFLHMTGHGNVVFSDYEAENLRNYLIAGGFLHIDDNYGMEPYVRLAMKKVFPGLDFVEVPFEHPIYHQKFDFPNGLPKIHEHDGKPPQGFGIFWEGKLVVFFTFECDLGDGWEDQSVHNDPAAIRLKALQMGANIISFAFSQ